MIGIAVFGTGAICVRRHLPDVVAASGATLVSVIGHEATHTAEVARRFGARYATADPDVALADPTVDAVIVAGVNSSHADLTVRALLAGKHVLVEKPMATSVADALRMTETARETGRILMVAQNERLHPVHRRARTILASGRLGRVLTAEAVFAHGGPERWTENAGWFFSAKEGVLGVLGDLGIHKVDLLRYLLADEILDVQGRTAILDKDSEVNDNAVLILRFASGTLGTVLASWTARGRSISAERFLCEEGALEIDLENREMPLRVTAQEGRSDAGKQVRSERGPVPESGSAGVVDVFLDSLRTGVVRIPGEEGLTSLAVCEAGRISDRTGRRIWVRDVLSGAVT